MPSSEDVAFGRVAIAFRKSDDRLVGVIQNCWEVGIRWLGDFRFCLEKFRDGQVLPGQPFVRDKFGQFAKGVGGLVVLKVLDPGQTEVA